MKKYIYILLTGLLFASINSCKKFTDDYRYDPNGFTSTVPEHEMLGLMLQNQFFHKGDGMRLAMMWMNQASGVDRQYKTLDNWNNAAPDDFNGPWTEVYKVIGHAKLMEQMAEENNNTIMRGIGKLFRAWAGGQAASLWGDVPFSEAGDDTNENPKYDSQTDVFNQVQNLLNEAINDLNSGNGDIPVEKDIYFEGNITKWTKIAHGIKARMYLHTKEYQNALSEALLGPSSTDDDLFAIFDSNDESPWGMYNPTAQFQIQRSGDFDASEAYAPTLFDSRANTKTDEYYRKAYNYTGNNLNTNSGFNTLNNLPKTGKFFGNMPLITYAEMLLIATEATLRTTSNIDDALVYYNQYRDLLNNGEYMGNFNEYGPYGYDPYVASDFDNGGMENPDGIDPKSAFLREIFEERYLFFIGDYEAFIDYARSHNDPMIPQYIELQDYDEEPLRFIYPQVEKDANNNYPGTVDITIPLPIYN